MADQAAAEPSLDELLDRLEAAIARLAGGQARLEDLVHAYEEAQGLAGRAEAELERVRSRLTPDTPPAGGHG